jgi:hypothetical protein
MWYYPMRNILTIEVVKQQDASPLQLSGITLSICWKKFQGARRVGSPPIGPAARNASSLQGSRVYIYSSTGSRSIDRIDPDVHIAVPLWTLLGGTGALAAKVDPREDTETDRKFLHSD